MSLVDFKDYKICEAHSKPDAFLYPKKFELCQELLGSGNGSGRPKSLWEFRKLLNMIKRLGVSLQLYHSCPAGVWIGAMLSTLSALFSLPKLDAEGWLAFELAVLLPCRDDVEVFDLLINKYENWQISF